MTATPAEQLRAAASKVRATAKNAAPWPWNLDGPWWWDGVDGPPEATTVISTPARDAVVVVPPPRGQVPADGRAEASARWIALVSPALAEPLAVLLEHAAEQVDEFVCEEGYEEFPGTYLLCQRCDHVFGQDTPVEDNCTCYSDALAIARHILDTFPLPPSS